MNIKTVKLTVQRNIGQYEFKQIEMTVDVEDGADASETIHHAAAMLNEAVSTIPPVVTPRVTTPNRAATSVPNGNGGFAPRVPVATRTPQGAYGTGGARTPMDPARVQQTVDFANGAAYLAQLPRGRDDLKQYLKGLGYKFAKKEEGAPQTGWFGNTPIDNSTGIRWQANETAPVYDSGDTDMLPF